MNEVLTVDKLRKEFGGLVAVKDVSFEVKKGEIFGLLGPNGAGKSTTILMLTTLLQITGGQAKILDLDVAKDDKLVREKIGVALQDTGIDNLLTGRELFFTTARLWGFSKTDAETRTSELLELVGLEEAADRRVKTYSGGMKRRLDLGLSLVNSPEILFLDEPTTGLDPGSRRVLWDEIKRLRDRGVTVILTTQYLEEADELADRIAIIDEGEIIENDSMLNVLKKLKKEVFILNVSQPLNDTPLIEGYTTSLKSPHEIEVSILQSQGINEVFTQLDTLGIRVISMRNKTGRLEELFIDLTNNPPKETAK